MRLLTSVRDSTSLPATLRARGPHTEELPKGDSWTPGALSTAQETLRRRSWKTYSSYSPLHNRRAVISAASK